MKRALKIGAIVIGLLILILIAVPFFIHANVFRPTLDPQLTDALGRPVKVGNLSLRLFSGSVTADNIAIADDPQFSKSPFVQAKSLKVGVEMMPLIFSKTLNVTELTLDQPEIRLVQNGERWNFSSLGGKNTSAPPKTATPASAPTSSSSAGSSGSPKAAGNPNLSVAKLDVNDGRVTISKANSDKERVYDKVNIEVNNFAFDKSFPFQLTANTPSGGTAKLSGNAGPIDANDAASTPLDAKISVQ